MKIIVCIKQVPDTTNVRINPETNTLVREGCSPSSTPSTSTPSKRACG